MRSACEESDAADRDGGRRRGTDLERVTGAGGKGAARLRERRTRWLILGNDDDLARQLARRLHDSGTAAFVTTAEDLGARITREGPVAGVCYLALAPAPDALRAPCLTELALTGTLAALRAADQPRLLFVTRGAQQAEPGGEVPGASRAPLWGFARVVRNELPGLRCTCVDLDPISTPDDQVAALVDECMGEDDDQVAGNRVRYAALAAGRSGAADRTRFGPLDELGRGRSLEPPFRTCPHLSARSGRILDAVRAAGLNFKDVLHALGALEMPAESGFGFDGSGIVVATIQVTTLPVASA